MVLTAGHCTDFFDQEGFETVLVTFDSEAAVDPETWLPIEGEGTWYEASSWETHPDYVEADWPFTYDYGVILLEDDVVGIEPANLPTPGLIDELVGTAGQTGYRFLDVGYGVSTIERGGGTPVSTLDFVRKVASSVSDPGKVPSALSTRCGSSLGTCRPPSTAPAAVETQARRYSPTPRASSVTRSSRCTPADTTSGSRVKSAVASRP
ncbi:hypothetical protein ACFQW6_19700 [Nocardioides sp. GCM10028917]|uniref:hypothetical protein n=1 Tax=Nocardioides sp. GCM10028917 TaxID=3273408 RepID=UPI003611136A